MFVYVLVALLACANGGDPEPKFQVLTPDELMVQVPHYDDRKLVTFRMGVRRAGHDADDLELGENDISDDRVFIYDQRLGLKQGDVVNYLLVFRDRRGYQAQSGNYYFNGVYYKKPFNRHRFRRDVTTSTEEPSTLQSQYNTETEEFDPTATRFGGGGYHPHHHRGGHWPQHGHGHGNGFNPFGGPRVPYPNFPPPGRPDFGPRPPGFGGDCDDHSHDRCHGRDTERWMSSTASSNSVEKDLEYHCKICNSFTKGKTEGTTGKSTTEETSPDIDIRFSD